MLKGQVQAQLTFLPVSLKPSRKEPRAEVSGQAAAPQGHEGSVPGSDTHSTSKATLSAPRFPFWEKGQTGDAEFSICAQSSSPAGTGNTREAVTDPDQHFPGVTCARGYNGSAIRPHQNHCEHFTCKTSCI